MAKWHRVKRLDCVSPGGITLWCHSCAELPWDQPEAPIWLRPHPGLALSPAPSCIPHGPSAIPGSSPVNNLNSNPCLRLCFYGPWPEREAQDDEGFAVTSRKEWWMGWTIQCRDTTCGNTISSCPVIVRKLDNRKKTCWIKIRPRWNLT